MSSSINLSMSDQCSGQSDVGRKYSAHPNQNVPLDDIVRHVVEVHHVELLRFLAELEELRPRLAGFAPLRGSQWGSVLRRFVRLHDGLRCSIDWEASKVFPQLLQWQEVGRGQPPEQLLAACKLAERSHAWCLHMLWRLQQLTRDEMPLAASAIDHHHFLDCLMALGSEYEQHLYEVECLLFPLVRVGVDEAHLPSTLGALP